MGILRVNLGIKDNRLLTVELVYCNYLLSVIQVVLVTSYNYLRGTMVVRIGRHGLVYYLVCAYSCRSKHLSVFIVEVVDLSCLYFFFLFVGLISFFSIRLCAA